MWEQWLDVFSFGVDLYLTKRERENNIRCLGTSRVPMLVGW